MNYLTLFLTLFLSFQAQAYDHIISCESEQGHDIRIIENYGWSIRIEGFSDYHSDGFSDLVCEVLEVLYQVSLPGMI